MAKTPRYLTKSRFKIGNSCPTKLFYTKKEKEYVNSNLEDPFLKALAGGGFQIGAMAQLQFEGGVEVKTLDYEESLKLTAELLKKEEVTIFEAAVRFENLFVRVDVLKKTGNKVELIEVKSKTWDPEDPWNFFNQVAAKSGVQKLHGDCKDVVIDIAFQAYVLKKAHPEWTVEPYLMLANKRAEASVDGLNQLFFLKDSEKGRPEVILASGTAKAKLGKSILHVEPMATVVDFVHHKFTEGSMNFEQLIAHYSKAYADDSRVVPELSKECKKCEFQAEGDEAGTLKSGFKECWTMAAHLKESDFLRPFVYEIWNFRKTDELFADKKYFIDQIEASDVAPSKATLKKYAEAEGLAPYKRQHLQIEKVQKKDTAPFVDADGLRRELGSHKFPLHFIDFETATVAIPFHKGRRPYEQIAFQFSHHVMAKDGKLTHSDQYLHFERGKFPNFEFLRALKKVLENDHGTIFMFSPHENTVLCQIYDQLAESAEKDREELMSFIQTVTESKPDKARGEWCGDRHMVDLCELVKKYYFHPLMEGSNSIKKVLPAILNESAYLKNKYAKPVYGAAGGIGSLNFKDQTWLKLDSKGMVQDPYKQLPPIFAGISDEALDSFLFENDELRDGGAALMAYAKMQFTQMTDLERETIRAALFRYCELDTLAMVMLYEYWQDILKAKQGRKAA